MKSNPQHFLVAALAALVLAGCASTSAPPYDPATAYAKALPYPERLTPATDGSQAQRWTDPAVDFSKYKAILFERIRVQLDPASSAVDPNDLKALTDYFHQALVKAVQPPYPITDQPGPGVLRVRITLVDLLATNTAMSVVVLATPYATLPDMISGAASGGGVGSAPYLGRTGIAVTFLDGETSAVVAEYAETKFGQKYVLDTHAGVGNAVSSGVDNYLKAYSTWAYAQQAFDQWAQHFRSRLDAWHKAKTAG